MVLLGPEENELFVAFAYFVEREEPLFFVYETLDDGVVPDVVVVLLDEEVEEDVGLVLPGQNSLGVQELVLHSLGLLEETLQLHVVLEEGGQFGHSALEVLLCLLFAFLLGVFLLVDVV